MDPGEIYARMGKEALMPLLARTSILFITEAEYALLFGSITYDKALKMLYASPNFTNPPDNAPLFSPALVIKQGKKGASCYTEDGDIISASPNENIEVIDNTGAGDAFNAGFIHAYLNGSPPEECLNEGNRLAARSLTAWGRNWMKNYVNSTGDTN